MTGHRLLRVLLPLCSVGVSLRPKLSGNLVCLSWLVLTVVGGVCASFQ